MYKCTNVQNIHRKTKYKQNIQFDTSLLSCSIETKQLWVYNRERLTPRIVSPRRVLKNSSVLSWNSISLSQHNSNPDTADFFLLAGRSFHLIIPWCRWRARSSDRNLSAHSGCPDVI